MTTKVSDERLAMWIAQAPRDSNCELAHEVAMMAVELQEKRALVKECLPHIEDVAKFCDECNGEGTVDRKAWPGGIEVDYEAKCETCLPVRALLARVRGEI